METKITPSLPMTVLGILFLFWTGACAQAIDVAGIQFADLSHYSEESLHNEATFSSRNHGIVVIAYTDFKTAEQYCHLAGPYKKSGAQIRSVLRAGAASGKTFDIYYNGMSYVRGNKGAWPRKEDFTKVLAPIVELQSVDLRLAAKQREADALEKEIKALDRKIDAYDRILELSRDPDINK